MSKSCAVIFYVIGYFVRIKFIYSEKATKFCKIFTLLLSYVVPVKSKMKISQNYVAFSEYMNFKRKVKLTLYMFVNQSVVNFTTHGLVYSNSKWLKSFHHTWSTHSNSLATFQTFWIYFPRFAGYTYNGKTDK